jgi:hypothetical protein
MVIMNDSNNNLIYDRQTFLRVFSSLHLKDDIPPYVDKEDLANRDRV